MLGIITDSNGTSLLAYITAYTTFDLGSLSTNVWRYIGLRSDSSGNAGGFISAANGGTITFTSTASIPSYNGSLYILTDSDAEWINAGIENVKIWSAALTDAEIYSEMWSHVPERVANLWGWWPLLDANDQMDRSGNARNLTKAGSPTTENGPPIGWNRRASGLYVPSGPQPITSTVSTSISTFDSSSSGLAGVRGTASGAKQPFGASVSGNQSSSNVSSSASSSLSVLGAAVSELAGIRGGGTSQLQELFGTSQSLAGIRGAVAASPSDFGALSLGSGAAMVPTLGAHAIGGIEFQSGPSYVDTSPTVTTRSSGFKSLVITGGGVYDPSTESQVPTNPPYGNVFTLAAPAVVYPNYGPSDVRLWWSKDIVGGPGDYWRKGGNANSEFTLGAVEIIDGNVAGSVVSNVVSSGTSFNSGTIHAGGPAILVLFFNGELWLNSNPTASGWQLLNTYNGSGNSIQCSVFARQVDSAGDYSATVSIDGPSQGAILYSMAIEYAAPTVGVASGTLQYPTILVNGKEVVLSSETAPISNIAANVVAVETDNSTAIGAEQPFAASASSSTGNTSSASSQLSPLEESASGSETFATTTTTTISVVAASSSGSEANPSTASAAFVSPSALATSAGLIASSAVSQMPVLEAQIAALEAIASAAIGAETTLGASVSGTRHDLISSVATAALSVLGSQSQEVETISSTTSDALSVLAASVMGTSTVAGQIASVALSSLSVFEASATSSHDYYVSSASASSLSRYTALSYSLEIDIGVASTMTSEFVMSISGKEANLSLASSAFGPFTSNVSGYASTVSVAGTILSSLGPVSGFGYATVMVTVSSLVSGANSTFGGASTGLLSLASHVTGPLGAPLAYASTTCYRRVAGGSTTGWPMVVLGAVPRRRGHRHI